MAFFEDMFKGGNIATGVVIAVGTAVLVPVIGPAVGGLLRPAAKAVIKGGIVAYDWGRQAAAQVGEATSDMVAEVRTDAQRADTGAHADARPRPAEPQPT
jgi:hypothetical protein